MRVAISGSPYCCELEPVERRQVVEHAAARAAASMPVGIREDTAPGRRCERNLTPWYCDGRKPLPHSRSYSG